MTTKIVITPGQRITNSRGAWAELRHDPEGGYVPGLGPQGVWYVVAYSPDFVDGVGPSDLISNRSRQRCEQAIRRWLASRPLSEEEIAAFDREHRRHVNHGPDCRLPSDGGRCVHPTGHNGECDPNPAVDSPMDGDR